LCAKGVWEIVVPAPIQSNPDPDPDFCSSSAASIAAAFPG
jgi:hypothetical protein